VPKALASEVLVAGQSWILIKSLMEEVQPKVCIWDSSKMDVMSDYSGFNPISSRQYCHKHLWHHCQCDLITDGL